MATTTILPLDDRFFAMLYHPTTFILLSHAIGVFHSCFNSSSDRSSSRSTSIHFIFSSIVAFAQHFVCDLYSDCVCNFWKYMNVYPKRQDGMATREQTRDRHAKVRRDRDGCITRARGGRGAHAGSYDKREYASIKEMWVSLHVFQRFALILWVF